MDKIDRFEPFSFSYFCSLLPPSLLWFSAAIAWHRTALNYNLHTKPNRKSLSWILLYYFFASSWLVSCLPCPVRYVVRFGCRRGSVSNLRQYFSCNINQFCMKMTATTFLCAIIYFKIPFLHMTSNNTFSLFFTSNLERFLLSSVHQNLNCASSEKRRKFYFNWLINKSRQVVSRRTNVFTVHEEFPHYFPSTSSHRQFQVINWNCWGFYLRFPILDAQQLLISTSMCVRGVARQGVSLIIWDEVAVRRSRRRKIIKIEN